MNQALRAFGGETADTVLNALPHPVLMVAPDGKIGRASCRERVLTDV